MLRHASVLAGATFIMAICGIATNIIWARLVPQEIFGGFKVIFALVNMIGTMCLMGTGQATLMSAAQNADGNLARIIRAKLVANVGGSLLLLAAASYYAYGVNASESIAYGLVVAALLFPAYNIVDLWTSWLNGKARFRELATGRALIYILPLLSVIAVAIFSISELWQVALVYFILTSIQNVVMLRRILLLRSNSTDNEGILAFGRHTTVAMMLGGIVSVDILILNHLFSARDVAIYSVALVLPDLIKAFLNIVNQLFAPKINNGQPLAIFWATTRSSFLILTVGLVTIGVFGFLFLPMVLPFIFSEKYIESAQYSKWLWLIMACVGSLGLLGNALIATRKLVYTYTIFLGYPAILVVFFFIFATDGIIGMVMARILAIVSLHLFYAAAFFFSLGVLSWKNSSGSSKK